MSVTGRDGAEQSSDRGTWGRSWRALAEVRADNGAKTYTRENDFTAESILNDWAEFASRQDLGAAQACTSERPRPIFPA
jgi:hypothetical protein